MVKLNFSISEFLIDQDTLIPGRVADAILRHHIQVMQPVRDELKIPVIVSKRSGFRSIVWEKSKGRSGNSEHTFPLDSPGGGRGAADYTLAGEKPILTLVTAMLRLNVPYNRIALYPGNVAPFIHCDYRSATGELQLIQGPGWNILGMDDFFDYAETLK